MRRGKEKACYVGLLAVFAVFMVFVLAGCGFTPQGSVARQFVAVAGAKAFDEGLANAEWYVCKAASIGSIQRRYGKTKESVRAYNDFCGTARESIISIQEK